MLLIVLSIAFQTDVIAQGTLGFLHIGCMVGDANVIADQSFIDFDLPTGAKSALCHLLCWVTEGAMQTSMPNIAMAKDFGSIDCCYLDPVNRLPHQMGRCIAGDASRSLLATLPTAGPR